MPSAVLRTLCNANRGDVAVFTHGDVVTDVWFRDHREAAPVFYRALPVDPVALTADFAAWRGGAEASAFVEDAVDPSAYPVEDGGGDLIVGIRCYGEWWVTAPTPLELTSIPWGPDDTLTATDESTLHRVHLRTMTREVHLLGNVLPPHLL